MADYEPRGLTELAGLVEDYGIGPDTEAAAIIYGSTARTASPTSDLDILIVEKDPQPSERQQAFVRDFIDLHRRTGRTIDTEVPYENKLFYSLDEVHGSFAHAMFETSDGLAVPSLEGMQEGDPYFASPDMKLRLCFNAFTSAHLQLAGSRNFYAGLRSRARRSLGELVRQLTPSEQLSDNLQENLRRLIPPGLDTKDYLGYYPTDTVFLDTLRAAVRKQSEA